MKNLSYIFIVLVSILVLGCDMMKPDKETVYVTETVYETENPAYQGAWESEYYDTSSGNTTRFVLILDESTFSMTRNTQADNETDVMWDIYFFGSYENTDTTITIHADIIHQSVFNSTSEYWTQEQYIARQREVNSIYYDDEEAANDRAFFNLQLTWNEEEESLSAIYPKVTPNPQLNFSKITSD